MPIDYTAYYVTPQIQCDYTLDPAFCAPDSDWKTTLKYDNATDLTETLRNQYESTYEVNQAIDWINRQDSNKPWFMYLAFRSYRLKQYGGDFAWRQWHLRVRN